ncbi:MAG: lamin tail domain-containing protein, partial [Bacteroidota bacterium]
MTKRLQFVAALAAAFLLVPAAYAQIVITEIMYNPASSESNTQTQYVELYNAGSSAVDISGWQLDDEDADGPNTIPAGTTPIPAGGVALIVGSSAADFNGAWSTAA